MGTTGAGLTGASGEIQPSLAVVAARGRPVTAAADRLVDVVGPLAALLPDRGLRRGSTVSVAAGGARTAGVTSLAAALMVGASAAGGWCAVVGMADLGVAAVAAMGVALERLALVPEPGEVWPVVTAALLESADVVVVQPPGRVRHADGRRLGARARECGAVLVTLDPPGPRAGTWPEVTDLRLVVTGTTWAGLGDGHGHLSAREVEVVVTGRRAAARERRGRLWLPGSSGGVEAADDRVEESPGGLSRSAGAVTARSAAAAAVLAAAAEAAATRAAVRDAARRGAPSVRAG